MSTLRINGRNSTSKVHLNRNANYQPHGRNALAKTAYRYGFANVKQGFIFAPEGKGGRVLQMKAPGDQNEAVEIATSDIALDLEYDVPVKIGSPEVKLDFGIDTGSSDFNCWSTHAREGTDQNRGREHIIYDPERSRTARLEKCLNWQIIHGDGANVAGDVHSDHVRIGDISVDKMCVQVTQELSESFVAGVGSDGVLGFGWPKGNTVKPHKVTTWFDHALSSLEKPLFTANLSGHGGFYTFGYVDETVTSNEMHYTTVDSHDGKWKVQTPYWKLNGEQKIAPFENAVIDTGTPLILLDDASVAEFYQSVEGAQLNAEKAGWTFPVTSILPTVAFTIGYNEINISPYSLTLGEADDNGQVFGTIQSCGDLGYAVFGDSVLKNCYAVFNQGTHELGVAQKSALPHPSISLHFSYPTIDKVVDFCGHSPHSDFVLLPQPKKENKIIAMLLYMVALSLVKSLRAFGLAPTFPNSTTNFWYDLLIAEMIFILTPIFLIGGIKLGKKVRGAMMQPISLVEEGGFYEGELKRDLDIEPRVAKALYRQGRHKMGGLKLTKTWSIVPFAIFFILSYLFPFQFFF